MVLIDQLEDSQAKPARRRVLEMSAERLELSTNGLKGHCSTIELRAQVIAG